MDAIRRSYARASTVVMGRTLNLVDPRYRTRAIIGLLLFVAWTGVVRRGISQGSRHAVWRAQSFGSWPVSMGPLEGSDNMELSIRAGYRTGGLLGSSSTGTTTDYGDSSSINGSRFVTGTDAGTVTSMSVYVAAPVDTPPYNQFELAIYADSHGSPDTLLGRSARGTLTADAWNTVPLTLALTPRTPYWLVYNNNGTHDAVNNATFLPLVADPLDSAIRSPRSASVSQIASLLTVLGSPAVAALVTLFVALWIGSEHPVLAGLLCAGLAAGMLLELALKHTLFFPYATYPSGHALRVTFLATSIVVITSRRIVRVAVPLLAVLVSLSAVHRNNHYSEEVIGGALAGWALASVVVAVAGALAERQARERLSEGGSLGRRSGDDRRRRDRRGRPEPVRAG